MDKKKIDNLKEITVEHAKSRYAKGGYIEDEFIMFEEIAEVPIPIGYLRFQSVFFAICTAGEAKYKLNTKDLYVEAGDAVIVTSGQVVSDVCLSSNFKGFGFMLSLDFFHYILSGITNLSSLFMFSRSNPVFRISKDQIDDILEHCKRAKKRLIDRTHPFRRELIACLIRAMIYDFGSIIYKAQHSKNVKQNRAEVIFNKFMDSVQENFKTERRVSWYARELNITAKYLSEVVKLISKRTPREWIDYYVVLEIRVLLRSSDLSVKEISNELHFANQSFMGKYFREHVGISPLKFRRS